MEALTDFVQYGHLQNRSALVSITLLLRCCCDWLKATIRAYRFLWCTKRHSLASNRGLAVCKQHAPITLHKRNSVYRQRNQNNGNGHDLTKYTSRKRKDTWWTCDRNELLDFPMFAVLL